MEKFLLAVVARFKAFKKRVPSVSLLVGVDLDTVQGVCVYYCRTYDKAVCGGRGTVKDMCYEVRRAEPEACVD